MSTQKQGFKHNLIEELSNQSVRPDERFKDNLENLLVRELVGKPQNNFLALFNMSKMKFAVAGIATLAVVASGAISYPFAKDYYVRRTVDVNEVLSKAAKNKEGLNSSNQRYGAFSTAAAESDQSLLDTSYLGYFPQGPSYTHSKTTYDYGPAADRCEVMAYPMYDYRQGSSESFSYWNDQEGNYQYYDKYITLTEDGQLLSYYLVNEDGSYTYYGGKYAIKDAGVFAYAEQESVAVEEVPLDEVSPTNDDYQGEDSDAVIDYEGNASNLVAEDVVTEVEPVEPDEIVWGENQQILGSTEINGREHYIVSYEYYTECDIDPNNVVMYEKSLSEGQNDGDKIVVVSYIDSENSNLSKEEFYIGSRDSSNLITSTTYIWESSDLSLDQVRDKFKFDYDVEIREVGMNYASNYWNLESIKELDIEVLVPSNGGWSLNDVYNPRAIDEYSKIYMERDLYPNTDLGQKMYEEANKFVDGISAMPLLTAYYDIQSANETGLDYGYMDLNIQESGIDNSELIELTYGQNEFEDLGSTNLSIDGRDISGQLYKMTWTYLDSMPAEDRPETDLLPVEEGVPAEESTVTEFIVIFEYDQKVYLVHIYKESETELLLPDFETLNSKADYAEIENLIKEYQEARDKMVGGSSGSGGATEPMPL